MQITEPTRKLLYKHEVLRAKLELKDHMLESVVRDIYEQTGQVLSLVRFQLATIQSQLSGDLKPEITDAGNLVGEAISRLRKISKKLFPEQGILTHSGFIEMLHDEWKTDVAGNSEVFQVSGTPATLALEPGLLLLAVLLNIISSIKTVSVENTLRLKIEYTETEVVVLINYRGKPIDLGTSGNLYENDLPASLNIHQRLRLISGSISTEKAEDNTIAYEIKVPL